MTESAFPFHINPQGLLGEETYEEHVRDMIEQLLFTAQGERVNRPKFGCGLDRLVFAAAGGELITATQAMVQGELQRWLGDVIQVRSVNVSLKESELIVKLQYTLLLNGKRREEAFHYA